MRTGLITLFLTGCPTSPVTFVPTDLPPPACPTFQAGAPVGVIPSPPASELSGIAVAPDGRLFVHNDSGEDAEVHVLQADGSFLGTWALEGVDAIDFEDIAIGPARDGSPFVWVGDIGDNGEDRESIVVYRFPLPTADSGTLIPERIVLTYPDEAHNAETLFIDGAGALWIVIKDDEGDTGFYRVVQPGPGVRVLQRVFNLQFGQPPFGQATQVTGGDFGERGLVLRTYLGTGYIWPVNAGEELFPALERPPCTVQLRSELQSEAIAWSADGLLTVSEGDTPELNLHRFVP